MAFWNRQGTNTIGGLLFADEVLAIAGEASMKLCLLVGVRELGFALKLSLSWMERDSSGLFNLVYGRKGRVGYMANIITFTSLILSGS